MFREEPVEQSSARSAHMQISRRRGRKTHTRFLFGTHSVGFLPTYESHPSYRNHAPKSSQPRNLRATALQNTWNLFHICAYLRVKPMRARFHHLSLALLLVCLAAPLHAQDAAKILNEYVRASGGARALSKIQTITLEGTVAAQNGAKPGAYTFDVKLPNRYYSEMVMGDQSWIEVFQRKIRMASERGRRIRHPRRPRRLATRSRRALLQFAPAESKEEQARHHLRRRRTSSRQSCLAAGSHHAFRCEMASILRRPIALDRERIRASRRREPGNPLRRLPPRKRRPAPAQNRTASRHRTLLD